MSLLFKDIMPSLTEIEERWKACTENRLIPFDCAEINLDSFLPLCKPFREHPLEKRISIHTDWFEWLTTAKEYHHLVVPHRMIEEDRTPVEFQNYIRKLYDLNSVWDELTRQCDFAFKLINRPDRPSKYGGDCVLSLLYTSDWIRLSHNWSRGKIYPNDMIKLIKLLRSAGFLQDAIKDAVQTSSEFVAEVDFKYRLEEFLNYQSQCLIEKRAD